MHRDKNNINLQLFNSVPYNLRQGVNETEMTGKVALEYLCQNQD